MFYIYSDISIDSNLEIKDVANQLSRALKIVDFKVDTSGRYEGSVVYSTVSFGLEFELVKDEAPLTSYHLSINTDTDSLNIDSSAKDVDGTKYVLSLIKDKGIIASERDKKLLYD